MSWRRAGGPGRATVWIGVRHPQTQGKVARFHGTLEHALEKRGAPCEHLQQWLDAYRCEHNHLRPHMALRMRTPATLWRKSQRRYDPNPPEWQYPQGTRTLKVDCQGTIDIKGQRYRIGKTLAGERVLLQPGPTALAGLLLLQLWYGKSTPLPSAPPSWSAG